MQKKLPLLVILGPTGSGKSDLAIKLAKRFKGEIVNADSRQIYKDMYIGTGSPFISQSQNQKSKCKNQNDRLKCKIKQLMRINGVPHHLFHVVRPDQEFTVAHYKQLALKVINDIHRRGKLPILVGGTGLYIRAVTENLSIPEVKPNKKLRAEFEKELMKERKNERTKKPILGSPTSKGSGTSPNWAFLSAQSAARRASAQSAVTQKYYQRLLKLDPETTVDPHNPRRIIRALEVCLVTGKPFSSFQQKGEPLFNILKIGLKIPTKTLYKKTDQRVEKMIKMGWVEETEKLMKKYSLKLPALSGIGYREVAEWLKIKKPILGSPTSKGSGTSPNWAFLSASSAQSTSSAQSAICFRTHAYARRQMTWFRKEKNVTWISKTKNAEPLVRTFLKLYSYEELGR